MASIRDRMRLAGPMWNAMGDRLDALITAVNSLGSVVFTGMNPHIINDVTNVVTASVSDAADLDTVIDLAQDLITKYEAHLASTSHHLAADSTNVVTEAGVAQEVYTLLNEVKSDYNTNIAQTPATEVYALLNELKTDYEANRIIDPSVEVYALLNELKVDYEAHRVLTAGSVHGAADSTNVITAADATTKASAETLANDLRTQYEAHRVLTAGSVHGAADATNTVSLGALSSATWSEIAALANELRVDYEAHRVLTAASVHGGTGDTTNTVTATAVSALHHEDNDSTNAITSADATTKASAETLANELKTDINAHMADTAVHAAADATNPVVVADLSSATWTEIAEMADAIRVAYEAHRILTAGSVHGVADATNTVTASAVGSVHHLDPDVTNTVAAADATTKASAVTLANELKADFNLHIADTTYHTAADATNPIVVADLVPASATWTLIAAMTDAIRAAYEAHRQLTAGSVHAVADSTNTVTATAVGTIQTAVNAGLNELKADFNNHINESGTSHSQKDASMAVATADASSLATSSVLANALKTAYADHITQADDFTAVSPLSAES